MANNLDDYIKDTYTWPRIPEDEIKRLAKNLYGHLKRMGIKMNVQERLEFTNEILDSQAGTCAFAGGEDEFCWNEPKDKDLKYLKLQWGHKIPVSHGKIAQKPDNLILLCARCNNNIQKSRSIKQLIPELEHKLKVLRKLLQNK